MGTKISGFPAASTLDGTEVVPVLQGGADKQTTASAIAALASSGGAVGRVVSFGSGAIGTGSNYNSAVTIALSEQVWAFPLTVAADVTISSVHAMMLASSATSCWQGVYSSGTNGLPNTLLASVNRTSAFSNTTTGAALGNTFVMSAGKIYWIALLPNGTGSLYSTADASIVVAGNNAGVYLTRTYAAGLPATFGTPTGAVATVSATSGNITIYHGGYCWVKP